MGRSSTIGLDIGSSAVRAAQLAFDRSGVELEKIGQLTLPEGAVEDGAVVDRAAVTSALRQLWRNERFDSKHVHLGVANQRVVVREVTVPDMPPADLAHALPFQVQDVLPVPVESVVMDFHALERTTDATGAAVLRGLLVAVARDMVLENVAAVQDAGLVVDSVDLVPFAVLRAVGGRMVDAEGVEALVDIGLRVTCVVIHSEGVPSFVRILMSGGSDLTDAICEDAGTTLAEAEEYKRAVGVVLDPSQVSAADEPSRQGLERGVRQLVGDIRNTLAYYASAHAGSPAERIVLSGGGGGLLGLPELLAEDLRLPVAVGDPARHLQLRSGGRHLDGVELLAHLPGSAVPVGLALGGAR